MLPRTIMVGRVALALSLRPRRANAPMQFARPSRQYDLEHFMKESSHLELERKCACARLSKAELK